MPATLRFLSDEAAVIPGDDTPGARPGTFVNMPAGLYHVIRATGGTATAKAGVRQESLPVEVDPVQRDRLRVALEECPGKRRLEVSVLQGKLLGRSTVAADD